MILAFSGKSLSGKSTASGFLCESAGFTRVSFAKPLKLKVQSDFKFTDDQVFGAGKDVIDPRYGLTPREALIIVGNAYRSIDQDYWANLALSTLDPDKNYVIDDCRFLNEVRAIESKGGHVIRLVREGIQSSVAFAASDVSETELDAHLFEHTIRANTVEDSIGCLVSILTQLGINAKMGT